jgi:DNA-binding CsgD family transcriptional regulator
VAAEADFLDLVYEAAVDPARWFTVLQRYADMMDGHYASLVIQDQVTGDGRSIETPDEPERHVLYFGHFAGCNPLLRIQDHPARPRVMTDEEKLPKSELIRTEFYNDFLRKYDMHSLLIARLTIEGSKTTVMNVIRSPRRETFGACEIETAGKFLPHLARAVRLAERFACVQEESCGTREMIDRSSHAAFLVAGDGRIRYLNRAAENLLAQKRGLALRNAGLSAMTDALSRRLQGLVAAAASRKGERTSGAMAIPRPGGRRPLSIIVSPVPSDPLSVFCSGPLAIVSARDPDLDVSISEQRIRDVLGLTRAEARIALKLMEGCDSREAAQAIGISYYTVRAHLARIFAKTGTRGQADLIALLTRLVDHFQG